jgi:hypothetical protein
VTADTQLSSLAIAGSGSNYLSFWPPPMVEETMSNNRPQEVKEERKGTLSGVIPRNLIGSKESKRLGERVEGPKASLRRETSCL